MATLLLLLVLLIFATSWLASASQSYSPSVPSNTAHQLLSTPDANRDNLSEEANVQSKLRTALLGQAVTLQSEIDRTTEKMRGLLRDIDKMVKAKYYGELEVQRLKELQAAAQMQVQAVHMKEAML